MPRKNRNARKQEAPIAVDLIAPTPEQMARGYTGDFVIDDQGRKAWAHRNTNHDPIERWMRDNRIDQRQKAVIDMMRRLWDLTGIRQKLTANYGERIAGSICAESRTAMVIDAKDDLARIEGYFRGLEQYLRIFENVCRFGMSAGVAGCELGYGSRSSEVRAHQIVAFVCDIISTRENI